MSEAKTTADISKIRSWAEERNGVPAIIKGTGDDSGSGLLRIHFPEASDSSEDFEKISWDEFGETLRDNNLVLLYQDKKENGETSTFHKIVDKDESGSR